MLGTLLFLTCPGLVYFGLDMRWPCCNIGYFYSTGARQEQDENIATVQKSETAEEAKKDGKTGREGKRRHKRTSKRTDRQDGRQVGMDNLSMRPWKHEISRNSKLKRWRKDARKGPTGHGRKYFRVIELALSNLCGLLYFVLSFTASVKL